MKVKVFNQKAEEVGTVELPDSVFGLKWNAALVHQVVTSQAANQRGATAHAKGRGEVRGGGKKPWKQKGTGRARHGSIRSPIWKGGGVTHGPLKERSFKKKINKKMARRALYTVLSAKAREKEIIILENLILLQPKTKLAAAILTAFAKQKDYERLTKNNGVLIVLAAKDQNVRRAFKNIPYVGLEEFRNLNAHKVLHYKYMIFSKDVIATFK